MDGSEYARQYKDPRWQRVRLEIMRRDNFTCVECGDDASTLNVHHVRYLRDVPPWAYPPWLLVTLCESCHEAIHGGMPTGDERLCSLARAAGMNATHFALLREVCCACFYTQTAKLTSGQWTEVILAFYSAILARLPEIIPTPESRRILTQHLAQLFPSREPMLSVEAENG
ncbi:HNH endonuclease [Paraburkholderia adhaesiva]|uniref:HNH endonuclease n=1 Tax=Paraburkholderia adhaesiva TaxID=2883244 RepID=UPI001F1AC391|nr:hypothetical protein [Paraburkholderia adhaesiva]